VLSTNKCGWHHEFEIIRGDCNSTTYVFPIIRGEKKLIPADGSHVKKQLMVFRGIPAHWYFLFMGQWHEILRGRAIFNFSSNFS
jgi:hypothetical protein